MPLRLKDAHYKGTVKLGHGTEYIYPHDYDGHFVRQQYLPEELKGVSYYHPTENGKQQEIKEHLAEYWGK